MQYSIMKASKVVLQFVLIKKPIDVTECDQIFNKRIMYKIDMYVLTTFPSIIGLMN